MARAARSGNGARSPVHYLAPGGRTGRPLRAPALGYHTGPLGAGVLTGGSLAADPGVGAAWSGAGGRWLLWPLRVALWVALLVIAFRGITAIVAGPAPARGSGAVNAGGAPFPVALAEAYAAEFGRVYLGFSPQDQGQREQALAAFVPAGLAAAHPDLGWNGVGQLNLQAEQVAGITVQDRSHAVVTLLTLINGQLMELGVPVTASGAGVVVSGEPAWLPAPPQASLPSPGVGRTDQAAQSQLMSELPAFFQAYASGDRATLRRFGLDGVSLAGLGGAVVFDSIVGLHVPPGGHSRQITATVIWGLPEQAGSPGRNLGMAPKLEMTYRMSVVDLQSGKWYVTKIGVSAEAVGVP